MKFHGSVGIAQTVETSPGVWEDQIEEKEIFGEFSRVHRSQSQGEGANPALSLGGTISILVPPELQAQVLNFRYVNMGVRWEISSIERDPDRPRATLLLGEQYNGPTP